MPGYIAIIHKDPGSDYGVSFPDFPGCVTAGTTLDEAREMALEALSFHIQGMLEDNEKIPGPSSLETIMANPDFADGVAFLVFVSEPKSRSVRVNVTFVEPLLKRIDLAAKRRGLSRSSFLAVAAQEVMKKELER